MHFSRLSMAILVAIALGVLFTVPSFGQQTSGQISGMVQDQQGAVVAAAQVSLMNQTQGALAGQMPTTAEGTFVFTPLQPGTYTLNVEASGFKKFIKTGIVLNTSDKLGLPPVSLELGSAEEKITVEASAVQLETVSAERSGVVTGNQMVDLALNGRNFTELMKTVAGVLPDSTANVNGQRTDQGNYMVDGATTMDSGNNGFGLYRLNTDAIA